MLVTVAFLPGIATAQQALPHYTVDETLPADLTHLRIEAPLPHGVVVLAYESVRGDVLLGPILSDEMIPALERAGPPEERLTRLTEIVALARKALEDSGRKDDESYFGLLPVETHLRTTFFQTLAGRIVSADDATIPQRTAALKRLRDLTEVPPPVGFTAEDEGLAWTLGARQSAQEAIDARSGQLSVR